MFKSKSLEKVYAKIAADQVKQTKKPEISVEENRKICNQLREQNDVIIDEMKKQTICLAASLVFDFTQSIEFSEGLLLANSMRLAANKLKQAKFHCKNFK